MNNVKNENGDNDELHSNFTIDEWLRSEFSLDSNMFDEAISDNEKLTFNGNSLLAKEYSENLEAKSMKIENDTAFITADNQIFGSMESVGNNSENQSSNTSINELTTTENFSSSSSDNSTATTAFQMNNFLTPHNPDPNRFLTSAEESRKVYILQKPRETRTKFLLRYPILMQECVNTGNLVKLKYLLQDVLEQNCLVHMLTNPPFVGRDKLYQILCHGLRNSPDSHVIFYSTKFIGRRIITTYGMSVGTLPYVNEDDKTSTFYNFLGSPLESLDEFHKLQKQKYDTLRSGKKVIKFERKTQWVLQLNSEANKIIKMMARSVVLEIFG